MNFPSQILLIFKPNSSHWSMGLLLLLFCLFYQSSSIYLSLMKFLLITLTTSHQIYEPRLNHAICHTHLPTLSVSWLVSWLVFFFFNHWMVNTGHNAWQRNSNCANKVQIVSLKKYSIYRKLIQINMPKPDCKCLWDIQCQ